MLQFLPIFAINFFLSLHNGALLYANSSLLASYFKPSVVSGFFFIAALMGILFYITAPGLVRRIGIRAILIYSLAISVVTVFAMALSTNPFIVALAFVIYYGIFYLVFYSLDLFLEEISSDGFTGEIRGLWIAVTHIGLISGLAVLSIYSGAENLLQPVFLAGGFLLLPTLLISLTFKADPNTQHPKHRTILPLSAWWRAKSVRRITVTRFTLDFFYAFMTIYTPLYLASVMGFSWASIGLITGIALLPFILLQWPAGKIADIFIGEKEILITGLLFIIGSLLFMPFIAASIVAWAVVLFFSRVGASLTETMVDSYFFKHISAGDTGFLSIYRLTRPISLALGATVGGLALNFLSFGSIFYILAFVVFLGLKEALLIRDTK